MFVTVHTPDGPKQFPAHVEYGDVFSEDLHMAVIVPDTTEGWQFLQTLDGVWHGHRISA